MEKPSKSEGFAKDGGKPVVKPMSYDKPKGPKGIDNPQKPGLHGTNKGCCGTQGKY